jgi:Rieske Fe-S protein
MSKDYRITRRGFVKVCTSALAMLSAHPEVLATDRGQPVRRYSRARLVHPGGRTFDPGDLLSGKSYVFHYPYLATPCFLINLGESITRKVLLKTEAGETYEWEGGVGPERSVVAFSAICAHRMSHPAPQVSFIDYRSEPASFLNGDSQPERRSNVIYCCSEKSVYDPLDGARVIGGPAKQPLAAIMLEYSTSEGCLYAVGSRGGEMFEKFFAKFGERLMLDYRTDDITATVDGTTSVMTLAEFSHRQIRC